jgi:hypothetical protein
MTTPGNYPAPQYGQPDPNAQPTQDYGYPAPAPMPSAPVHAQYAQPHGPVGKVRSTGVSILLLIVTLGIYSLFYYYATHDEMKKHTGEGIGGVLALVLAFFIGVASPFLLSHEVGGLYERRGQHKPVSAVTGLWYIPGIFILVGPIVWFVKTNGALNAYWRSVGAQG